MQGGLEPIEITDEMIDLIITTHEAERTFIGCLRGRCKKAKGEHGRCPTCLAYMSAADQLRCLARVPAWTVSGLPDVAELPKALGANPKAQAAWRRAWQLRAQLIEAAKLKLGEAS